METMSDAETSTSTPHLYEELSDRTSYVGHNILKEVSAHTRCFSYLHYTMDFISLPSICIIYHIEGTLSRVILRYSENA